LLRNGLIRLCSPAHAALRLLIKPLCKLRLARISTELSFQDRAEWQQPENPSTPTTTKTTRNQSNLSQADRDNLSVPLTSLKEKRTLANQVTMMPSLSLKLTSMTTLSQKRPDQLETQPGDMNTHKIRQSPTTPGAVAMYVGQCMAICGCSLPQIVCWQVGRENIMTTFVVQYRRFETCSWKWL
jgi:hypothetical protein